MGDLGFIPTGRDVPTAVVWDLDFKVSGGREVTSVGDLAVGDLDLSFVSNVSAF